MRAGFFGLVALACAIACGNNHGQPAANQPPVPHIAAPADGAQLRAGAPVALSGSATDPEDGALPASSLTWRSSVQGVLGTGSPLTVSFVAGTHTLSLEALDSKGLKASAQITLHVTAALNQAPSAFIDAPLDGAQLDEGQPATFRGHATDPEDGALPGAALLWTSSLDGSLGAGLSVTRAALSRGTHHVLLTATDRQGASAYASIAVTVVAAGANHPPTATISAPAGGSSFVEGSVVTFTGAGSDVEDAPAALQLAWSSSLDGALGTGTSVHTSTLRRGAHTVTLSVRDTGGLTGTAAVDLSIVQAGNHAPVASISSPADGTAVFQGTAVVLAGSATDVEDGALSGASLAWSSSRDGALGTGASLTVSTLTAGAHRLRLTATDSRGDSGTAEIGLTVLLPNQPPVAVITGPADGASFDAGQTVSLRGSAQDPEDGALTGGSLTWTSSLDGSLGHGAALDTQSLRAGAHTITLTAADSGGRTGSAAVSITVRPAAVNLPPVARLSAPPQGSTGVALTLDGSASTDSDGSIVAFKFSFGDGTSDATGTAASVTHAYAAAGTYTVGLTVTDNQGATGTASASVTISDVVRIPGVVDPAGDRGTRCSLALWPGGAAMAYRAATHPSLWFATVTASATAFEQVDGMGYETGGAIDSYYALALAADGTPHLVYTYSNNAQVWYATRSGGVWARERVDSAAVPRYSVSDSYVSIALDPAHSSRPTVAYTTFVTSVGYAVAIATRGASGWTQTVLSLSGTGSSSATFSGGLAISAAGVVYFSGSSYNSIVGAWTGSATSFLAQANLGPASHEPTPVQLDSAGRVVAGYANTVVRITPGASLSDATQTFSPFEVASQNHLGLETHGTDAWLAYQFGGAGLELTHGALDGYWQRQDLGPMDAAQAGVRVGADGNARACFFRDGKLMLY